MAHFLFLILTLSFFCLSRCCVMPNITAYEATTCEWACPPGVDFKVNQSKCEYKCQRFMKYEQKCCEGYDRDPNDSNSPCLDIDECKLEQERRAKDPKEPPLCDTAANFECVNTNGSYKCDCMPGFFRPLNACIDIDECNRGLCGRAQCDNTFGSYKCYCRGAGFELKLNGRDGKPECVDVDECADETIPQSTLCPYVHTVCNNTYGSFDCICAPGFKKAGDGDYCKDIDECKRYPNNSLCTNGVCENLEGSFDCVCNPGFGKNVSRHPFNSFTCFDVDECSEFDIRCPANTTCFNTPGSYRCGPFCLPGYRKHDQFGCIDINECAEGSNCSHYCHNEPGGYSCSCPLLFRLDLNGRTCLYGYIADEIIILLFVALAITGFSVVVCVCYCSTRIYESRKRRLHCRSPSPNSARNKIYHTVADSSTTNSFLSTTPSTKPGRKHDEKSAPSPVAAALLDNSQDNSTSSENYRTRFDTSSPNDYENTANSNNNNNNFYDSVPDYATAIRSPQHRYNSSNTLGNDGSNNRPVTIKRFQTAPKPSRVPLAQVAGGRHRPLSTSGIPVLPVNGRFPGAASNNNYRPHSATVHEVPFINSDRRPVLLPRYASTDDESPIICLLDEEANNNEIQQQYR